MSDQAPRCIAKNCGHGTPRLAHTGQLCNTCYARLERNLAETPALVTLVRREFIETGSGAVNDGSKRTKGEPPAPGSINAISQLVAYEYVLASWVTMITELKDLRGPSRWNDPLQASRWLLLHLPWISTQSWVADLIDEIQHATNGLQIITGEFVKSTTLSKACPYCSELSLTVKADASSDVVCRTEGCQDEQGEAPRWTRATWGLLLTASDVA